MKREVKIKKFMYASPFVLPRGGGERESTLLKIPQLIPHTMVDVKIGLFILAPPPPLSLAAPGGRGGNQIIKIHPDTE